MKERKMAERKIAAASTISYGVVAGPRLPLLGLRRIGELATDPLDGPGGPSYENRKKQAFLGPLRARNTLKTGKTGVWHEKISLFPRILPISCLANFR